MFLSRIDVTVLHPSNAFSGSLPLTASDEAQSASNHGEDQVANTSQYWIFVTDQLIFTNRAFSRDRTSLIQAGYEAEEMLEDWPSRRRCSA
jgi:hypothetical protein